MRPVIAGLLGGLAALCASAPLQAAPYVVGHCQLAAPDGWVASKSRIARPDKKLWASLMEAPTAAEILNVEMGLKATKVSEDAGRVLLVSSASFGGLTNRMYHAITKTSPSCMADVVAPAGAEEALAKQVALTVVMKK